MKSSYRTDASKKIALGFALPWVKEFSGQFLLLVWIYVGL